MLIINYTISEKFQRKLMVQLGGTQKRQRKFETHDKITEEIAQIGIIDSADNLIIDFIHPLSFSINSIADVIRAVKVEELAFEFENSKDERKSQLEDDKEWGITSKILEEPLNVSFTSSKFISSDWEKLYAELDNGKRISTKFFFAIIKPEFEQNENLKSNVENYNRLNRAIAEEALAEETEKRNDDLLKTEISQKDTKDWIETHGSKRLKLMYENGYSFTLTYEIERGKAELPEGDYNIENKKFNTQLSIDPSLKALEFVEQFKQRGFKAKAILDETFGDGISISPYWSRFNFIILV